MASTPLPSTPSSRKLVLAIESVLELNPFWRTETIRINGRGGMARELRRLGVRRSSATIRSTLKAMGLRTVGFGGVAGGLPSRERLPFVVREAVESRPEWRHGLIKVRGRNGLKQLLKERGYDMNQRLISQALRDLGYRTWPRGLHHAASADDVAKWLAEHPAA